MRITLKHKKRITDEYQIFFDGFSIVYMSVYLLTKIIRIENVVDSRSFEVNILEKVSAVVSPAGLFLKHFW